MAAILVSARARRAVFGVTTALVSITLSMFMLGMGAGSWLAGGFVRRNGMTGRDYPVTDIRAVSRSITYGALVDLAL